MKSKEMICFVNPTNRELPLQYLRTKQGSSNQSSTGSFSTSSNRRITLRFSVYFLKLKMAPSPTIESNSPIRIYSMEVLLGQVDWEIKRRGKYLESYLKEFKSSFQKEKQDI